MTASQSNGGDKDPNRRVSRGGGKPASAGSTFVPRFPGDRPGLDDISVRLPTPFQTSDFAAVAPTEPGPGVTEPVARPKAPATVSVVRSGRDLRLDALRGWCALAMVIDHFGGASWLYVFTGGNTFFASAAEGFIFLSGLLVGQIYGARIARDGLASVQLRLLGRAATLYGMTIGLTFLFIGLSRFASMPWLQDETPVSPKLVVSLITLHHTYYLVDVMLLYTILMLLAPGALLLLHTKNTQWVAGLTVGLWGVYQVFPVQAQFPWSIVNNDTFQVPAWQLWFFVGMIVGYHRDVVRQRLRQFPLPVVTGILAVLAMMTVWLYATDGAFLAEVLQAPSGREVLAVLFDKHVARVGRVVAFGIWFPLLYLILTLVGRPILRGLGWLLVPFGQNALYVYALHLFAVYLGALALPYVAGFDRFNPLHNTPMQILAVALIWIAVRFRLFFDVVPR